MTTLAQRYLDLCHNRPIPQLIIDTDPGQDDAAAIFMALGLEKMGLAKVLALTTVAGNVSLNLTSKNARVISDWAERSDLPVFAGADKPLLKPLLMAKDVHGNSGLGELQLHKPHTALQDQHAAIYLTEVLKKAEPYSTTICAIGPLTNIAHLLSMAPEAARGIKEIVVMGGSFFNVGNTTPVAEFNFYVDPHAAQMVMQSGVPLRIVPLDVTHKARLNPQRLQALHDLGNDTGARLVQLFGDHNPFNPHANSIEGSPLHDPCAIACAVMPELFVQKRVHVAVETRGELTMGACVVDWHGKSKNKPNAMWAHELDADAMFDLFNQAIATLP